MQSYTELRESKQGFRSAKTSSCGSLRMAAHKVMIKNAAGIITRPTAISTCRELLIQTFMLTW